jgi:hypothetical protein
VFTRRGHRAHERSRAARWRSRRELAGGLELAATTASTTVEEGRAEQDGVERGSPVRSSDGEVATGGGAEEVVGVGWALVTGNVHGELSELEGRRGKRMMCTFRLSRYVSMINDNHLVSLMNFIATKVN